jgi:hypothetical protein
VFAISALRRPHLDLRLVVERHPANEIDPAARPEIGVSLDTLM